MNVSTHILKRIIDCSEGYFILGGHTLENMLLDIDYNERDIDDILEKVVPFVKRYLNRVYNLYPEFPPLEELEERLDYTSLTYSKPYKKCKVICMIWWEEFIKFI
jgi:hypothetical protein